jgi:hypothetical protein
MEPKLDLAASHLLHNLVMDVALADINKYRDPNNSDPIDEKDVAFMYLVGFVTGSRASRRRDDPPNPMPPDDYIKKCAMYIRHFYCQEGYTDRCNELRGIRPMRANEFRLTLE